MGWLGNLPDRAHIGKGPTALLCNHPRAFFLSPFFVFMATVVIKPAVASQGQRELKINFIIFIIIIQLRCLKCHCYSLFNVFL